MGWAGASEGGCKWKERWVSLDTCGCVLKGPRRGEAAQWRVVERWAQQLEAGKCHIAGVVGPAVGVSGGGELERWENEVQSWLQWPGGQTLTPGPHPPQTCVSSSQLLCSRLPLPPHSGIFLPASVTVVASLSPVPPLLFSVAMAEQDVESRLLDYEEDEEPQAPPETLHLPQEKH